MRKKLHTIIFKEPNKEPVVMQIENSLEAEQGIIKGDIQKLDIGDNVCIVCDEEGKLKGKEPNIKHKTYGTIVGNIFIIGENTRTSQFASLTEKQVEKYINELKKITINIYDSYKEIRKQQQKEFDEIPKIFVTNEVDFKKGLKELGLSENDKNKVTAIGFGAFIRKADVLEYNNLQNKFLEEMQLSIMSDKTGEKFVKEMFIEEMKKNKYSQTKDIKPVLFTLGLTMDAVNDFENLRHGLELAKKEYLSNCNGSEQEYEEEFE